MMDTATPLLDAAEAHLLGCLAEKEATTPEQYPLTGNAALEARIAALEARLGGGESESP